MPYSGDPTASLVDEVRFWLQDTGTPPLLTDVELTYLVGRAQDQANGDAVLIAAACCTVIGAKYAGEVSITADGVSYSGEQLQGKYTTLRQALLDAHAALLGAQAPFAGGLYADVPRPDDVVRPSFGIGMLDNPEAGDQSFRGPHSESWSAYGTDPDGAGY